MAYSIRTRQLTPAAVGGANNSDVRTKSSPGSGGQYSNTAFNPNHERGSITVNGPPLGAKSSSGYSTNQAPTMATATSTRTFTGTMPTYTAPTFTAPEEWSNEKMAGAVQKKAALGLREARRSLREVTANMGTDPESQNNMRKALGQHSIDIERTVLGARSSAEQEESTTLNREYIEAQLNFNAKLQATRDNFDAQFQKYINSAKTTNVTTTGNAGNFGSSGMSMGVSNLGASNGAKNYLRNILTPFNQGGY